VSKSTICVQSAVGWCYRGAEKSLARPASRCILFDGENISFDVSLVIYIYIYIEGERESIYIYIIYIHTYTNSTNISPITTLNRIYENQNLLSL
jgi:hypothetical protein